ncbi:type VI secretion system-associated protein VasI [Vibrio fluminensis]|uniref:type VI secretion system-associated protein VasI n=1 Tax=Vibrio fluminensis TaxID=2783614 RepID=UPI001889340C|nr:type VI secretion system-associated protein VasI [Vibrio fluminensis]
MKRNKLMILTVAFWLGGASIVNAKSDERLVEQANQCRDIPVRLERLACFDELFSTPVEAQGLDAETPHYSSQWTHAMDGKQQVRVDEGWALVTEPGEKGNAWIAMPAQNHDLDDEDRSVLLLSCINNISRVELALAKQVDAAKIQVSTRHMTQVWRSDDYGVMFSSGRGIPAIEMMKVLAQSSHLVLRSNARFADGLQFNTQDLKQGLEVLRERCSW